MGRTGDDEDDIVAGAHPDIEFVKAGYLNDHPRVLDTFAERVTESDWQPPAWDPEAERRRREARDRPAVRDLEGEGATEGA